MGLFEQLETFVRVIELGSVTAAARARGWSTSKVSRSLDALEAELGCTLIVRSSRGTQLTRQGARFFDEAVKCLQAIQHARASVSAPDTVGGLVTLSVSVSWGLERLLPRLATLSARAPHLQVELRLEDHPADLVAEGIDLAIRGGLEPPDSTNYMARRIEVVPRVTVASPALLERRRVSPQAPPDLEALPALLADRRDSSHTWRFSRGDEVREVRVSGPLFTYTLIARKRAAVLGMGVTRLPRFVCEAELAAGTLVELLADWPLEPACLYAVYRRERRADPLLVALLEHLTTPAPDEAASRGPGDGPRPG